MARRPQNQEPRRDVVPIGGSRIASRSHTDGRLSSPQKAKLGPAAATTATAHRIAVVFYTMVSKQVEYDAPLWAQGDELRGKRIEARLQKQARPARLQTRAVGGRCLTHRYSRLIVEVPQRNG